MRMRFRIAPGGFRVSCFLSIIALVALPNCIAQMGAQGSAESYVLSGTVVNSTTGAAIPYALVQADQSAKLADQNGNFEFDHLSSPSVTVQAHKPGFFGLNEIGEARTPLTATLSDHPTTITIQLVPEAIISGHVENP